MSYQIQAVKADDVPAEVLNLYGADDYIKVFPPGNATEKGKYTTTIQFVSKSKKLSFAKLYIERK